VGYIVKSGIAKDRIIAKGYGETQLVNHCKNGVQCSDEVHRQNRRTEFKILEMDKK
jgi:outer membrane protein OmpA-like peptidoglycan-associated protein